MSQSILLVVDVQKAIVNEHPFNEKNLIENIKQLISVARDHQTEVIFVRHDDGSGTALELGSEGWQIVTELEPRENEVIIDKRFNSAFHNTELRMYLESKAVNTIYLVGLQTEYCIDATLKSAFDFGYKIILPEGANSTMDNEYLSGDKLVDFYNHSIWDKRFGDVIPLEDAFELLSK